MIKLKLTRENRNWLSARGASFVIARCSLKNARARVRQLIEVIQKVIFELSLSVDGFTVITRITKKAKIWK